MKVTRRNMVASLLAFPVAVHAQTRAAGPMRSIGYLTDAPGKPSRLLARLAEYGHVEGRNLRLDMRYVASDATPAETERVAIEMVRGAPDMLLAQKVPLILPLARATTTIPIVCAGVSNPVGLGLARTLANPGRNITGLSFGLPEAAKLQLSALRMVRPQLKRLIFVIGENELREIAPEHAAAAAALGISVEAMLMRTLKDAERGLDTLRDPAQVAAWVAPLGRGIDTAELAALAMRRKVATHAMDVDAVRKGLLLSYWTTHSEGGRRLAIVIDKVLRGADPARIPFELPDSTLLSLNRSTARALGVKFPDELVLRANEIVG